ncbi:outer membrane beta-barrel protein, partial [Roseibium sp.]|uniref:outer membrane beta-barrel protein n=1 Tax=Roseibium sp. TaxID=1936156 RepID=UPI003D0E53BC
MRRILFSILCFSALQAAPAAAQSALSDLRGSGDAQESETAAGDADQNGPVEQRNPTQATVYRLNAAEAETGSSGLGTNGRALPVRPFSDRIAAIGRAVPLPEQGIDTSVFGGDTTFDAPEGIRLGSFTLTPQLTLSSGWTDNTARSAGGTPGGFYRISPDVALTSNWSRHQADLSLRGSFTGYPEA